MWHMLALKRPVYVFLIIAKIHIIKKNLHFLLDSKAIFL